MTVATGLLLASVCFGMVKGLGDVVLQGDMYIELIENMYSDDACTQVDFESVQNMAAVKWTLSQLNDVSFMPTLKIGLRVSKTCGSVERAREIALNRTAGMTAVPTTDVVGVLGPGSSSQTEAVSRLLSAMPDQYRLLQISYSATSASLSNRDVYRNLFRTVPPDDIQVEVMREFLLHLNWTFMAVIYDNDTYGIGGLKGLQRNVVGVDICFPEEISINPNTDYDIAIIERIIRERVYKNGSSASNPPISGILVYGSSTLSRLVLTSVDNIQSEDRNRTIPVFLFSEASIFTDWSLINITRGSYVLSPPNKAIKRFHDYYISGFVDKLKLEQRDKFFKAAHEQYFECQIASNTCPDLNTSYVESVVIPSVYNQYAIQSAGIMAYATKAVHASKCGSSSNIVCDSFQNTSITPRKAFMDVLIGKQIEFDKDFGNFRLEEFQDPDLILTFGTTAEVEFDQRNFPLYEVYNYQTNTMQMNPGSLIRVAEYKDDTLQVSTTAIRDYDTNGVESSWPDIRKSQCPDGFASEFCLDRIVDDSILFIEGDMYIVGIVPVHKIGDSPLQCGSIKQGGVDIAEAIRFIASSEMKSEVFPNIAGRIGVIILDSCNDPQIVQERVLSLQRRGVFINGTYKPIGNSILGYIGGWSSDVSITVAQITTRLHTLQISYASTSTELSRRVTYPYFMRIPSPDDGQAKALLRIVKDLGGNFIQIIYSESKYGEGGRALLNQYADRDFDICIGNQIPVNVKTNPVDVIKELRKQPGARYVVLFVGSFELENILETLNSDLNRNEFLFIASEGWGKRQTVKGLGNLVGTITLSSQLNIDSRFRKYLRDLQPDGLNIDPWIRDYLENYHKCYYEWSFNKTSNKPCVGTEIIGDDDYEIEAWAPFAERAARVLLMAAQPVLLRNCGNTHKLCDNFNFTDLIVEIKKQTLPGANNPAVDTPVFDSNGDGTAGYLIFAVDQQQEYTFLGYSNQDEYRLNKDIYFNIREQSSLNSSCGNQDVCRKCYSLTSSLTDTTGSLPVGLIAGIVVLGIVCCVLAAILFFVCRRHGCCIRLENGRPKLTNTYLTPIYMQQRQAQGPIDGQEDRGLPPLPDDDNYNMIGYTRDIVDTRQGDGESNSNGSYNRRQQNVDTLASQNPGFDGTMDGQSSNVSGGVLSSVSSVSRSENVRESDGSTSAGGIAQTSFTTKPEPHKFIKPPHPSAVASTSPLTTNQQFRQQTQGLAQPRGVIYQPDGSYITAPSQQSFDSQISGGGCPGESALNTPGERTSHASIGSRDSLGYLRSVQTTEGTMC